MEKCKYCIYKDVELCKGFCIDCLKEAEGTKKQLTKGQEERLNNLEADIFHIINTKKIADNGVYPNGIAYGTACTNIFNRIKKEM